MHVFYIIWLIELYFYGYWNTIENIKLFINLK